MAMPVISAEKNPDGYGAGGYSRRRSILISVPVVTFFLAKKMAFIIDRMAERSDIFIQRWTLDIGR
jgi:hypothetical protein